MAELTILLTGAGAPGTRGALYALRHNPDGASVRTVGTDVVPDPVSRYWLDGFHQVPAPEVPGYLEAMLALCRREGVDLVIPQTTRELAVFAEHKGAFEAEGIKVMVAAPSALQAANDKAELLDVCRRVQVPHPAYRLAHSAGELTRSASELGYPAVPVVVKPPVSNGMRGFRVLRENAWDQARFLAEKPGGTEIALEDLLDILSRGEGWPALLVTEYLPGAEYSVDLFAGEATAVAVPRLRQAIRSGISFDNRIELREDVVGYSLRLAQELGLRYAFGFQFKLDADGVPKVLECNPRVQGTMVASLFAGVNVIWLAVKEALGNPPQSLPGPLRPAEFHRFWGGVGLTGDEIHEI